MMSVSAFLAYLYRTRAHEDLTLGNAQDASYSIPVPFCSDAACQTALNEVTFGLVALIGLVIVRFAPGLSAVIGVARDVTTYLTRSHSSLGP